MKMKIPAIRTVAELTETARKWGLSGYSRMKKTELIKLLSKGLKGKTVAELVQLARQWGLQGYSNLRKGELAARLSAQLKKITLDRSTAKSEIKSSRKKTAKKATPKTRNTSKGKTPKKSKRRPARRSGAEASRSKPVTKHDSLPGSYSDGRMVLLPRDPNWLYCYWDPTPEQLARLSAWGVCALRVVETKNGQDRVVKTLPVPVDARSWYIQVDASGDDYRVQVGTLDEEEAFEVIMVSNPSSTPPDTISEHLDVRFASHQSGAATVPDTGSGPISRKEADRLHALSLGDFAAGMDSAGAHDSRLGAGGMSSADAHPGRPPGDDSR